jgi:hypothetical protein
VIDVIAVPDGFEHAVGEAQGDQVLDRFPAQEVVDAKDRILREDLVHQAVQLLAALRSVPKGFSSTRRARSARPDVPSELTSSAKAPGGIDR